MPGNHRDCRVFRAPASIMLHFSSDKRRSPLPSARLPGNRTQSAPANARSGFALVVALSLMAFVLLLLLSISTLVKIENTVSNQNANQALAQQQAQTALLLALGELQEAMGPDRRISADSQILDTDSQPVARRNLIGVWDSLGAGYESGNHIDPLNPADLQTTYTQGRESRFRQWLAPDDAAASTRPNQLNFAQSPEGANEVLMLGKGSLGPGVQSSAIELAREHVKMPLITTEGGGYSWWIGQENTKARIALDRTPKTDTASSARQLSGDNSPAIRKILGLETAVQDTEADKISELSGLGLGDTAPSPDQVKEYFFDLSPHSRSLLTDVYHGGPKKDLNLLLEQETLPEAFPETAFVSRTNAESPFADSFTPSTGTALARWSELHAYYRIYKPLEEGGNISWDGAGELEPGLPIYYLGQDRDQVLANPNRNHFLPITTKWYWLLSHYAEPSPVNSTEYYELRLIMDQVFEIWNPFNVPYMAHGGSSQMKLCTKQFVMPYGLAYYVNGSVLQSNATSAEPNNIEEPINGLWEQSNLKDTTGQLEGTSLRRIFTSKEDKNNQQMNHTLISIDEPLLPGELRIYSDAGSAPQLKETNRNLEAGWLNSGGSYSRSLGMPSANSTQRNQLHVKAGSTVEPVLLSNSVTGWKTSNENFSSSTWLYHPTNNNRMSVGKLYSKGARKELHPALESAPAIRAFTINDIVGHEQRQLLAMTGARLKTEQATIPSDSTSPTSRTELALVKPHLFTDITNQFSEIQKWGNDNDQKLEFARTMVHSAHEFFTLGVNSFDDGFINITTGLDGTPANRGFSGYSNGTEGQNHIPTLEVPFQPILSLAQFQHAPIGNTLKDPDPSSIQNNMRDRENFPGIPRALSNSFAQPFIETDRLEELQYNHDNNTNNHEDNDGLVTFYDKSYLANVALWDHWFCSSITPQNNPLVPDAEQRSMTQVLEDALSQTNELPNTSYQLHSEFSELEDAELQALLEDPDEGYKTIGAYMSCTGGFNVNSTSVNAWKAFISGLDGQRLKMLDSQDAQLKDMPNPSTGVPVSRFTLPNNQGADADDFSVDQAAFLEQRWQGVRYLNDTELTELATEIVAQVKLRGPFLSLSDFINRRLDNTDLAQSGALQSAIDNTSINDSFRSTSRQITMNDLTVDIGTEEDPELVDLDYPNPEGALGSVAEGAPGYVTQADLLMPLAPKITVRSDTFRIRGYGQTTDLQGRVTGEAWCEAVVQRIPEFVDSSSDHLPELEMVDSQGAATGNLNATNAAFGRKFVIKSFRWLTPDEV